MDDENDVFIRAAIRGDGEIVSKMLASNPMRVQSFVKSDWRLISQLVKRDHVDIIRLLLSAGIDLNIREHESKSTALHFAAMYGHTEICALLIEYGKDVYTKDYRGMTPLHEACSETRRNAWPKRIRNLIEGKSSWYHVAKMLMDAGADVEARTEVGLTPLFIAAWLGSAEMVSLLITYNVDLLSCGPKKNSVLHEVHCLESMKLLISAGAVIDSRNELDQTPLMLLSAREHSVELIECLIDHGADVNARDLNGRTALDYALTTEIYDVHIGVGLGPAIALLKEYGGSV